MSKLLSTFSLGSCPLKMPSKRSFLIFTQVFQFSLEDEFDLVFIGRVKALNLRISVMLIRVVFIYLFFFSVPRLPLLALKHQKQPGKHPSGFLSCFWRCVQNLLEVTPLATNGFLRNILSSLQGWPTSVLCPLSLLLRKQGSSVSIQTKHDYAIAVNSVCLLWFSYNTGVCYNSTGRNASFYFFCR